MTLSVPLGLRLATTRGDRHVTPDLDDLTLRWAVPGGNASAQARLNRPLAWRPEELAYYGDFTVYDRRNATSQFDGRNEDPGRFAGPSGQSWDLVAVGGAAHAHDRAFPYIVVDSDTEDWEPATNNIRYCQIERITSNDEPAILFRVPEGTTWNQGEYGEVWYRRLVDSGQRLARLDADWDASEDTTNNEINIDASVGTGGANDNLDAAALSTSGGTLSAVITTDWSAGTQHDVPRCLSLRNGPTVVVSTQGEMWFIPKVRAVLWTKAGVERTAASNYTVATVKAEEVVEDLLGRILTEYDGANAVIGTSTYGINQLAYREAVDSWKIFDDLMVFHPSNYWAAWERNPATGKYRFEWRQWPSTVRYEFDANIDGFDSPGSATELHNRVSVRYVGAQGHVRHRVRTSTVPLLDDAGLIREHYIDLKFDAGSEANAIQAGDQFLIEHSVPLSAGRLSVNRKVLDRDTGIMVEPWEIRPGHLCRVRGIDAYGDALNPTGRDGHTVFRMTAVEFRASSRTSTIELDSAPLTLAHSLARK